MIRIPEVWVLVQRLLSVFTKPCQVLFLNILEGWILCPCRRFVTSIYLFGDPERVHAHDAYHRFFRAAAWSAGAFFHALAILVVGLFGHPNCLWVIGDDTVHKKTGRKVAGAKYCRDAVRSTSKRTVYAWGLQIVLLCLEVRPPWGGEPLALPINMRLYRKRPNKKVGKTVLDLMQEMIEEVKIWFPDRQVYFVGDGFYASLAGKQKDGVHVISRIRRDAALYRKTPQPVPGKRGRRPCRGSRLPTPAQIAATAKTWKSVETLERGQVRTRLVHVRRVVWDSVLRGRYINLVISRDPNGVEKDDFFFSTDLALSPELIISRFADRWPIEDTFRNVKQFLGIEEPQSWKNLGPERVAAVGYAIYSLVWAWFLKSGDHKAFPDRPWYQTKARPSFQDALAGIRHQIWLSRISPTVLETPELHKFTALLIDSISRAA